MDNQNENARSITHFSHPDRRCFSAVKNFKSWMLIGLLALPTAAGAVSVNAPSSVQPQGVLPVALTDEEMDQAQGQWLFLAPAAPAVGSGISAGAVAAGAGAAAAGAAIGAWLGRVFSSSNDSTPRQDVNPPVNDYPEKGNQSPAPGYTWQGKPGSQPGSKDGNWVNPEGNSLRPDFSHPEPIGPHWDYKVKSGEDKGTYRWFPDGSVIKKP